MLNSSVESLYIQDILNELRATHNHAVFAGRKIKLTPWGYVCEFVIEPSRTDKISAPSLLITRFSEGSLMSYASGAITVFEPTGATLQGYNVYSGDGLIITGPRAATVSCENLAVPIGSLPDVRRAPFFVDRERARLGNLVIFNGFLSQIDTNSLGVTSSLLPRPTVSDRMHSLLSRVYSMAPGFILRRSKDAT